MAWRNIWRTPWRSLVVIGAMSLGVWSGIFMMGWINGLNDQRTISMLDDNVGHGRICSKDFLEKPEVFSTINNLEALSDRLVADSNVTTFSSRVICNSMIQAGSGSAPIIAYGVNPNNEKKVFKIPDSDDSSSVGANDYFAKTAILENTGCGSKCSTDG